MCAGISGNVLINEKTTRLLSYNVWNYAEGYDSFYRSMLVDLTQPPGRVSQLCLSITIIHDTVRWLLFFSAFSRLPEDQLRLDEISRTVGLEIE